MSAEGMALFLLTSTVWCEVRVRVCWTRSISVFFGVNGDVNMRCFFYNWDFVATLLYELPARCAHVDNECEIDARLICRDQISNLIVT